MENPFLSCKTTDTIPALFIKHQFPAQIPSKPTSLLAQKSPPTASPPPKATRTDRHLSRLCRNGQLQEAILVLEQGSQIGPSTYISLLQSCIDSDSIDAGRRLHASIGSVRDPNPFVQTKLVSMYAKCGSLEDARRVFHGMHDRNLFAWSAMINGCAREQRWEEVVDLFIDMMHEGLIPDRFLLPKICQACANTGNVETGMLLHSLAVRAGSLGSSGETHVGNSILAMYAKCGDLGMAKRFFKSLGTKDRVTWNSIISGHCQWGENEEALRLFEEMRANGYEPGLVTWNILITSYNQSGNPERAMELMKQMESSGIEPDVFTWTSMISGLAQNNRTVEALELFREMQLSGVKPNGVTVASAISACASLKALGKGKVLHSYAVKMGSADNMLVGNALVDMYASCASFSDASRAFDQMRERDIFTWNSMIGGYALAGYCGQAYSLFAKMEDSGVRRNVVTWNAMISGYIQNGDEDQAMELFQRMERDGVRRNTASWNTLIAGFLQNGHANEALRIFRQMQSVSVPNSVTILSILPACANLISAWKVKEIHACILHNNLLADTAIANALIDTYAKSGDIHSALTIFNGLSMRDLISWNSVIAGCVLHGYSQVALDLFHQMRHEGIKPNRATLSPIINAYSLEGMVREGKELFFNMTQEYQLSPSSEHYTGMVHLFGRSFRLREASDLIEQMPVEPDSAVWDALLTAARIHNNIRLVTIAAEHLCKLEGRDPRIHRLLTQIQTSYVKSNVVSKVRKPKKESKIDISHGCCWIEIGNKVHSFLTGDQPTMDLESKFAELNSIAVDVDRPDIDDIRLDFEEEKEEISGIHCEKLAIAFGIVNCPRFRSIRIIKSARMCKDCHTASKFISKVHQREILVKDPMYLHHFKDGKCSCRDYW